MNATKRDFVKIDNGPYGTRWSFTYDSDKDYPPTVEQAEKILGVKLCAETEDCSGERTDGRSEEVYFASEEYSENTVATYKNQ